jgi:hypothetical protein
MDGIIFNSRGNRVGTVLGPSIFDLRGQKLYDLKGTNVYKLSGELVGHLQSLRPPPMLQDGLSLKDSPTAMTAIGIIAAGAWSAAAFLRPAAS